MTKTEYFESVHTSILIWGWLAISGSVNHITSNNNKFLVFPFTCLYLPFLAHGYEK